MTARTGRRDAEADGREAFRARFGEVPRAGARAPGRINWIGEHTDYEQGLVLPSAIDRDTLVFAAPAKGRDVEVHSEALGDGAFTIGALARRAGWIDYLQGVAWALGEEGHALPGAKLWIGSQVPANAGLSSSAALCVAVTLAFEGLGGFDLGPRGRARVAHRAESEFVGIGNGILDPFASALGRRGVALRIDCRDQSVREIAFRADPVALLVAESGVERRLAEGGYRERVEECRALFAKAREVGILDASATALRDLRVEDLEALGRAVPPRLLRRARHIATENERVDAAAQALGEGDWNEVGRILSAGQASLRDDYEVSVPALDLLCEVAEAQPGCFGSRLTGAGWGGCTLHLVEAEAAERVAAGLREGVARQCGKPPVVHALTTAEGATALP